MTRTLKKRVEKLEEWQAPSTEIQVIIVQYITPDAEHTVVNQVDYVIDQTRRGWK